MQELPHPLLTLREHLYTILASILSGGVIVALFNWLTGRRKTRAEVLEIHASTAKIEVEAREASTRTILAAQARIVELVDINVELQREVVEANRRADNFEFDLNQARFQLMQTQSESQLDKMFIEQLKAANELGLRLSEVPPVKRSVE